MSDNITITESAKQQISVLSQKNNNWYVRLAIVSGGCNGFSKLWSFDETLQDDDSRYQCLDAILIIDTVSLEFLKGSTIDYKKDLIGSYFTVDIPTASSSCGCGTSFSI